MKDRRPPNSWDDGAVTAGVNFGRLTTLGPVMTWVNAKGRIHHWWLCRCACRTEKWMRSSLLISGASQSCGCLQKELASARMSVHGRSKEPEYASWSSMKKRCDSTSHSRYDLYGERGITYCQRWASYDSFLADMGRKPSMKHSLDRIDTNGNYEPSNCRWATDEMQANNKRSNHTVKFNGEAMSLKKYCRLNNLKYGTRVSRINKYGWSLEDVLDGRAGKNVRR